MAKIERRWSVTTYIPVREVFAVMEQLVTLPLQFEPLSSSKARGIEVIRRGFFGGWGGRLRNPHFFECTAVEAPEGTLVQVEATASRWVVSRAEEFVTVLTRGAGDPYGIYRDGRIQPGEVTLVASWAGTGYELYSEPSFTARRGPAIYTATPLFAVEVQRGRFVRVETRDGISGYVEADQLVMAPALAVRAP